MDKDNSTFDFDNDPKFNENFYKNIEKALDDSNMTVQKPDQDKNIEAQEKTVDQNISTQISNNATDNSGNAAKTVKQITEAENEVFTKEIVKSETFGAKTTKEAGQTETKKAENRKEAAQTETKKAKNRKEADKENGDEKLNKEVNEEVNEDDIDEQLTDINDSLAKQISDELDNQTTPQKLTWKQRFFRIRSGLALTLLCLAGIGFFLGGTKPGNMLLIRAGINFSGTVWDLFTKDFDKTTVASADVDQLETEDLASDASEVDTSTIVWPNHPGEGRQEDGVYNILLLGEEQIGMGDGRGRTDSIVIATLNTNDRSVKLTSLMRDMLVQIPGYQENKLNTAYEKGGLDLLYETISSNFDIKLDGCVMVNFENFEQIVDEIGGLDLTLKENEAYYLNHTNYISNKKYRNVVAGTQHLNGNQVLGYARVRKTSTITGNNNDYGRTDRHRIVLNAIYEKCKSKSKTELAYLMFKFLPMITTDINSSNFQMLLNSYLDMGMSTTKITQIRIPVNGAFEDNKKVRGMSVLIVDFDKNIQALHSFIFNDPTPTPVITPEAESGDSTTGSSDN